MSINGKKAITLFVDAELYNKYKKFCDARGLKFSKGFEFYMQSQLSKPAESRPAQVAGEVEEIIRKKVKEILNELGGRHGKA